jgi:nucleotide-binding universal stress UspA family protein
MLIVGTDFSETAALAVSEARILSAELGVGLQLVHVRTLLGRDWTASDEVHGWLQAAGFTVDELLVRGGTPWVELVRSAKEQRARFIVVGTHGRSGFQPVALGSTASRLALLAPLPVLMVGSRDRVAGEAGPQTMVNTRVLRKGG